MWLGVEAQRYVHPTALARTYVLTALFQQNASPDQPEKSETAFPTASDSKVEKPLPVPKDAPGRPRRISVKVSKILSSLPSPGKPKEEKTDSGAQVANEGTNRSRFLERVGNIVNRKPKLPFETSTEAGTKTEGGAVSGTQEVVVSEDSGAPAVPPKSEGEL